MQDVADVIERRFESHIINVRPDRARYRSLTDTQLQIIRKLIRPGATENPFPERLQLRNWFWVYGATPPLASLKKQRSA